MILYLALVILFLATVTLYLQNNFTSRYMFFIIASISSTVSIYLAM